MLEVPAKFAEMITEQFKVQCTYAEKGCKEAIPFKVRKIKKNVFGKRNNSRCCNNMKFIKKL